MKKFLCVIFSAIIAVTFVSCSNADNIDPNKHTLDLSGYAYPNADKKLNTIDTGMQMYHFLHSLTGIFIKAAVKAWICFILRALIWA